MGVSRFLESISTGARTASSEVSKATESIRASGESLREVSGELQGVASGARESADLVAESSTRASEAAGSAKSSIESVSKAAGETATQVERQMEGVVSRSEAAAGQVGESVSRIRSEVRSADEDLERRAVSMTRRTAGMESRLDEFKAYLQQKADEGDVLFESLLAGVKGVETGVLGVDDLINSFGRTTKIVMDDRLVPLQTVLRDLLPNIGEVQGAVREFVQDIRGQENEVDLLIGKLRGQMDHLSQTLADLGEGYFSGKHTLEDLIEQLRRIQQAGFGGSSAGALGEGLVAAIRRGQTSGELPG